MLDRQREVGDGRVIALVTDAFTSSGLLQDP
jgi:hypothetical protein